MCDVQSVAAPSPGPRQRADPGGRHRSRRHQYSDQREDYREDYGLRDTSRLLEEEGQYNA